jgi:ribose transport system ATP-binding protein
MSGIDAHDEFALWVIRKVQLHRNSALRWRAIWQQTHDLGRSYDVRPNNPDLNLGSLSGGNQQKVVMAKWLQTAPHLLLLDEPTQGVDVGARQQLFAIPEQATRQGTSVICASTDYEQLSQICDRGADLRPRPHHARTRR